ncbi:MAG: penicillin-binding protein activator LpoB [Gammaproteobacteria bacterium]|nr:MAG: penicillin-binding protein activator LpoB [Gammaproteobacteria bacterium]
MSSTGRGPRPPAGRPGGWRWAALLPAALGLLAAGCATVAAVGPSPPLDPGARWAVVPFANQSETPEAGERAAAVAAARLRLKGVAARLYRPAPPEPGALPPLDGARGRREGLAWARREGYRYVLTGSVQEWAYKGGLEGEPVVGLTLELLELKASPGAGGGAEGEARVLWTATGARTGWGREGLAGNAQRLLARLLEGLRLGPGG